MTVNGPSDAGKLGITLMHEHLFVNVLREYRRDGLLNDPRLARREVEGFMKVGGETIVDVTTAELGQNPLGLRAIMKETGVNIIMGTGHYRDPYLDKEWFDSHSVDAIAELMVRDIEHGVGETNVRAGIIGEIGSDKWYVSAAEERSFRAAARAQARTGVTITTHAARWPVGRQQLEILLQEGADPHRIIIGHCDSNPDLEYHQELARQGCFVEFDTIRGTTEYDTERVADYVVSLIRAGFGRHVLLSHDVCLRSHLRIAGGCGYSYVMTDFIPYLHRLGLNEEEIHMLIVDNPRRALAGE